MGVSGDTLVIQIQSAGGCQRGKWHRGRTSPAAELLGHQVMALDAGGIPALVHLGHIRQLDRVTDAGLPMAPSTLPGGVLTRWVTGRRCRWGETPRGQARWINRSALRPAPAAAARSLRRRSGRDAAPRSAATAGLRPGWRAWPRRATRQPGVRSLRHRLGSPSRGRPPEPAGPPRHRRCWPGPSRSGPSPR